MTLPTDYVDGDVLTAADVNAITTAVNAISPLVANYDYTVVTTQYTTTSTSFTNTGVSLSYTPINASNDLVVEATFRGAISGAGNIQAREVTFQLYDDTNASVVDETDIIHFSPSATTSPEILVVPVTLRGVVDANSTTARTYVVRQKSLSTGFSSVVGLGANNKSVLTVTEVLP